MYTRCRPAPGIAADILFDATDSSCSSVQSGTRIQQPTCVSTSTRRKSKVSTVACPVNVRKIHGKLTGFRACNSAKKIIGSDIAPFHKALRNPSGIVDPLQCAVRHPPDSVICRRRRSLVESQPSLTKDRMSSTSLSSRRLRQIVTGFCDVEETARDAHRSSWLPAFSGNARVADEGRSCTFPVSM